jgi:hypothetical protein
MRPTLVSLALILACRVCVAGDPEPPIPTADTDKGLARSVVIDISASGNSFKPLEPIVLSVRAENRSGQRLLVVGGGRTFYSVAILQVFDRRGKSIPKTRFPIWNLEGPDSSGQPFHLTPGSRLTGKLVANLIYDMSEPGEYQIVVGLRISKANEAARDVETTHSKVLRVHVVGELPVPDEWTVTQNLSP